MKVQTGKGLERLFHRANSCIANHPSNSWDIFFLGYGDAYYVYFVEHPRAANGSPLRDPRLLEVKGCTHLRFLCAAVPSVKPSQTIDIRNLVICTVRKEVSDVRDPCSQGSRKKCNRTDPTDCRCQNMVRCTPRALNQCPSFKLCVLFARVQLI